MWGLQPSRKKYDYSSAGASTEVLTITTTDSKACVGCVYRLAVYAWKAHTRFAITASMTVAWLTEDGAPIKDIEAPAVQLQTDVRTQVTLEEGDEVRLHRPSYTAAPTAPYRRPNHPTSPRLHT